VFAKHLVLSAYCVRCRKIFSSCKHLGRISDSSNQRGVIRW
jgi:hypothetical protein